MKCFCGNVLNNHQDKYCSKSCFYKYRKRPSGLKYVIVKENPTTFKKGHISWNKGILGDYLPHWKGDKVSYDALHEWVQRRLGKPLSCINCGSSKRLHWANKSHEYKRDLSDWISLCQSCHGKYDSGENRGAVKRKWAIA